MKWFLSVFFSISLVFLAVFGVQCGYGYTFPMKYQDEVENASQICDVDEAVIFSVINIESHFNKDVVSPKGAVGLMQVMPSTASDMADEVNLKTYDLKNPEENILLGTSYISYLCERFENLETALASYNAGPSNVTAWLNNPEYSDDGKTLKKVPFAETRNYLEKFRKNYRYYKTKV